jgi:hypothetical protein
MKKILLILFLCFTFNTLYAQSTEYAYLVKTEVVGYMHANFNNLSVTSDTGGGGNKSYQATFSTSGNIYYDIMSFPNNFDKITIDIYSQAIKLGQYPDCEYRKEEVVIKENFNSRGVLSFGGCSFTHSIYPLHVLGPDTLEPLCTRSPLELSGGYDWQYYIGSNTTPSDSDWVDYASSVTSISVNVGDLYVAQNININDFPVGAPQRSLKFRTGHKASNKFVTPINYQVIGCSPAFKGYYENKSTSCFYKSDGEIALKLDRDLDVNERLVATLYNKDGVLIGQETKEIPLNILDVNTYTYKWPNQLDYGKYYFLYQTQNKNLPVPNAQNPDNGSSWDKLIKTNEFEITRAKKVAFTATHLNDETCFGLGDGKIRLNITSGETSNYKYIIYEVNGTVVTFYRNWTTFTGTTTTIENLEKKTYRIKVQDTKGCFAR